MWCCLSGSQSSDRVRVEVLSLSLRPESRAAQDSSVVRLFVEYSLLDLPTVETPLSLPKPPQGRSANFNHSKGRGSSCSPGCSSASMFHPSVVRLVLLTVCDL